MSSAPATFPEELDPLDPEDVLLESGRRVPVARFRVSFNACPEYPGLPADRSWAQKPLVLVEKQAMFPEIACLGLLLKAGWQGVWADAPHRRYFDKMPTQSKGTSLDTFAAQQVARVAGNNGDSKAGCWDLVLWSHRTVAFGAVEPADRAPWDPSSPRARWLAAGLRAGMAPTQFFLLLWDWRRVAARRRKVHAG